MTDRNPIRPFSLNYNNRINIRKLNSQLSAFVTNISELLYALTHSNSLRDYTGVFYEGTVFQIKHKREEIEGNVNHYIIFDIKEELGSTTNTTIFLEFKVVGTQLSLETVYYKRSDNLLLHRYRRLLLRILGFTTYAKRNRTILVLGEEEYILPYNKNTIVRVNFLSEDLLLNKKLAKRREQTLAETQILFENYNTMLDLREASLQTDAASLFGLTSVNNATTTATTVTTATAATTINNITTTIATNFVPNLINIVGNSSIPNNEMFITSGNDLSNFTNNNRIFPFTY